MKNASQHDVIGAVAAYGGERVVVSASTSGRAEHRIEMRTKAADGTEVILRFDVGGAANVGELIRDAVRAVGGR